MYAFDFIHRRITSEARLKEEQASYNKTLIGNCAPFPLWRLVLGRFHPIFFFFFFHQLGILHFQTVINCFLNYNLTSFSVKPSSCFSALKVLLLRKYSTLYKNTAAEICRDNMAHGAITLTGNIHNSNEACIRARTELSQFLSQS